jgi:hypothetical protein
MLERRFKVIEDPWMMPTVGRAKRLHNAKPPRKVTLITRASISPLSMCNITVGFERGPTGTKVFLSDRDYMPTGTRELVATLPTGSTYRKYVEFLVTNDRCALWMDLLEDEETFVEGADAMWAELMLMAWMHMDPTDEAHPHEVARALLTLDDAGIEALHREAGFFNGAFGDRVRAVLKRACELRLSGLSLAELMRRARAVPPSLSALETSMTTWRRKRNSARGAPGKRRSNRVGARRLRP